MNHAHAPHADQPPVSAVRPHRRSLPLRVGTRASPLALVQTRDFLSTLRHFCPVLRGMDVFEEHAIHTTGDAVQDRKLAEIGGKGLFAKEIHEALADGRVDFAVHSLKDLETELPPGIVLACTLRREDARDALILAPDAAPVDPRDPFAALAPGAVIGSASVRRQAQMLHVRPDLEFRLLRGNVQRRLDRVAAGDFAATLLAVAGLRRLGLDGQGSIAIDPTIMVPAACQGIVGVTVREADVELRQMLRGIEDPVAFSIATAERALLAELDGSCRTPIGGHAELTADGQLRLTGLVARTDGSFLLRRSEIGARADAMRLGRALGASLRMDSPRDIFV
jgi:hydroxymethylbilane synthase